MRKTILSRNYRGEERLKCTKEASATSVLEGIVYEARYRQEKANGEK